jgi:methionine-rich copper-binding protein CopC
MRQWPWLCLFVVVFLSGTAVAHAHADLAAASPAPGSTQSNPIGPIRLTFTEPVTVGSTIVLFDETFQTVPGIIAQPAPNDTAVIQANVPELAVGDYTVQWTAVSVDGHATTGSYTFRVAASNTVLRLPIPLPQPAILGLGIVLLVGIVLLWRRVGNP